MMEEVRKGHALSSRALCWIALPLVLMEYLFIVYLEHHDEFILFWTACALPPMIEGILVLAYLRGRREITRRSLAAPSKFQMPILQLLLLIWAVNYPYLIWCIINLTMRGCS